MNDERRPARNAAAASSDSKGSARGGWRARRSPSTALQRRTIELGDLVDSARVTLGGGRAFREWLLIAAALVARELAALADDDPERPS